MDTANSFPLSLDFEGKHYSGRITPSEEKSPAGTPVFFRVELGDTFFAYLCCSDIGWHDRDNDSSHPKELITAIGNYVADYYE